MKNWLVAASLLIIATQINAMGITEWLAGGYPDQRQLTGVMQELVAEQPTSFPSIRQYATH